MYAVGRIGSYITRGVYTVAGPFHPFGGAVDIIVVEQPDGSFKSSPWYVRFGKFQGVLKAREKVVSISVNGVELDFHMYLNQRGEAFFLREEEGESGDSVLYSSSSSDEADEQSQKIRSPMKSKSYNYDSVHSNSSVQIDSTNGKIIARTNSRRSRILGLMFGRRSMKEGIDQVDIGAEVARTDSLERAEIAANLLELQWSTNLATSRKRKDSTSMLSVSSTPDATADRVMLNDDGQHLTGPPTNLCKEKVGNTSRINFENMESPIEEDGIEMLSLNSVKKVSETALLGEDVIVKNCQAVSEMFKDSSEFDSNINYVNDNAETVTSDVNRLDSQNTDLFKEDLAKRFDEEEASDKAEERLDSEFSTLDLRVHDVPEAFTGKKFDEGQVFSKTDDVHVAEAGFGISEEESGYYDTVRPLTHVETSESLMVGLDGLSEQTYETLGVVDGGAGELQFVADSLHVTSNLNPESTAPYGNLEVETKCTEPSINDSQNDEMILKVPLAVSESCSHEISIAPTSGLFKDGDSQNCSISNATNLDFPIQFSNTCQSKAASISVSESSEEEQFFLSDLDESKHNESMDSLDDGKDSLKIREDSEDTIHVFNANIESDSFPIQESKLSNTGNSFDSFKLTSGPIDIPTVSTGSDGNNERLVESLPVICSLVDNLDSSSLHPLSHSLDSTSDTLEWTFHRKNESYPLNVETGNGIQSAEKPSNLVNIHDSDGKNGAAIGDANKTIADSGQSWGIWPFSFRRSRSRKIVQPVLIDTRISDSKTVPDSSIDANEEIFLLKSKVKKKVKAMTPTSEQLASLNLQEGRNVITFTFSTSVWGKQKVDASIYLWKWDARIVISDVDGTITRSDVLGQFMPLVGVDWSQTGVAHLFSGIKENGYQFLFLSARAISQAYLTRQFLVNLKQDGKALPDGPVVISPDGLFPSLFREVIRRAPHEFKIACLEVIKALFPPDCNPFYAGFGNRDTDELSYLKVGIPRGKIFTINPKGEVAVNRQVDTRSYTSLHTLVHDMFPPRTSSEQEDYNSWNFWRLPPPAVDI